MTLSPGGRVLLIEPEAGGHHFVPYAAALARALGETRIDLALMSTPAAIAHPAMAELKRCLAAPIRIHTMPEVEPSAGGSVLNLLRAQLRVWRAIRCGVRALESGLKPTLGVLLGLDSIDRAIAVLGSPLCGIPFVGLTIQAKHHWPALGLGPGGRFAVLNRWSFDRVLSHSDCLGMATIDQTLRAFESVRGRHTDKLRWVPDPGEVVRRVGREAARRELDIAPDPPLVLAYGGLDGRKNLAPLLAAARASSSAPLVALVGCMGPEVRALAATPDWRALDREGRLKIEDDFVALEREALWFGAADLLWVGYRADFLGQSAVIAQAASAGVPVLGRRGGLIGRTIEANDLGITLDPGDALAVAGAIERLTHFRRKGMLSDNLATFAHQRSHAAYGRAWCEALRAWWPPFNTFDARGQDA